MQEDEVLGKAYDARLMRRLLAYLRPYKWLVAGAFVLIFATGAVDLAPPYLTRLAIDEHLVPRRADGLVVIFAAFVGSLVLSFFFRYAQNYLMQIIGQRVMYEGVCHALNMLPQRPIYKADPPQPVDLKETVSPLGGPLQTARRWRTP